MAGLQFGRGPPRPVAISRVRLVARRGRGIEPVQVIKRNLGGEQRVKRGLVRLGESRRPLLEALERGGDVGMFVADGDDQQAHLQAPVAEVGVADHGVAPEAVDALDRFADDRGAQMPHVHFLGDIGSAIVDEDAPGRGDAHRSGARIGGDCVCAPGQRCVVQP